jgi:hypothetical protein
MVALDQTESHTLPFGAIQRTIYTIKKIKPSFRFLGKEVETDFCRWRFLGGNYE